MFVVSGYPEGVGSSLVNMIDRVRIKGAANKTNGSIAAQEISHDSSQFDRKCPPPRKGTLAIPAAIKDVNPA